jgi:AraC-like DNA-binding protein
MKANLDDIQDWLLLAQRANWSAVNLAKQCGVCKRTLERYFLKQMGKSPKVWLAEQRQFQALKVIQEGYSIKESSQLIGYEHPSQFSREFRKFWGYCPASPIPV